MKVGIISGDGLDVDAGDLASDEVVEAAHRCLQMWLERVSSSQE